MPLKYEFFDPLADPEDSKHRHYHGLRITDLEGNEYRLSVGSFALMRVNYEGQSDPHECVVRIEDFLEIPSRNKRAFRHTYFYHKTDIHHLIPSLRSHPLVEGMDEKEVFLSSEDVVSDIGYLLAPCYLIYLPPNLPRPPLLPRYSYITKFAYFCRYALSANRRRIRALNTLVVRRFLLGHEGNLAEEVGQSQGSAPPSTSSQFYSLQSLPASLVSYLQSPTNAAYWKSVLDALASAAATSSTSSSALSADEETKDAAGGYFIDLTIEATADTDAADIAEEEDASNVVVDVSSSQPPPPLSIISAPPLAKEPRKRKVPSPPVTQPPCMVSSPGPAPLPLSLPMPSSSLDQTASPPRPSPIPMMSMTEASALPADYHTAVAGVDHLLASSAAPALASDANGCASNSDATPGFAGLDGASTKSNSNSNSNSRACVSANSAHNPIVTSSSSRSAKNTPAFSNSHGAGSVVEEAFGYWDEDKADVHLPVRTSGRKKKGWPRLASATLLSTPHKSPLVGAAGSSSAGARGRGQELVGEGHGVGSKTWWEEDLIDSDGGESSDEEWDEFTATLPPLQPAATAAAQPAVMQDVHRLFVEQPSPGVRLGEFLAQGRKRVNQVMLRMLCAPSSSLPVLDGSIALLTADIHGLLLGCYGAGMSNLGSGLARLENALHEVGAVVLWTMQEQVTVYSAYRKFCSFDEDSDPQRRKRRKVMKELYISLGPAAQAASSPWSPSRPTPKTPKQVHHFISLLLHSAKSFEAGLKVDASESMADGEVAATPRPAHINSRDEASSSNLVLMVQGSVHPNVEDVRQLAQVLVDIRASMDDLTCTLILNTFLLYNQGCMNVYEFVVRMRYLLMVGMVVENNQQEVQSGGVGTGNNANTGQEDWNPVKRTLLRKLCAMMPVSNQAEIQGKYPLL